MKVFYIILLILIQQTFGSDLLFKTLGNKNLPIFVTIEGQKDSVIKLIKEVDKDFPNFMFKINFKDTSLIVYMHPRFASAKTPSLTTKCIAYSLYGIGIIIPLYMIYFTFIKWDEMKTSENDVLENYTGDLGFCIFVGEATFKAGIPITTGFLISRLDKKGDTGKYWPFAEMDYANKQFKLMKGSIFNILEYQKCDYSEALGKIKLNQSQYPKIKKSKMLKSFRNSRYMYEIFYKKYKENELIE